MTEEQVYALLGDHEGHGFTPDQILGLDDWWIWRVYLIPRDPKTGHIKLDLGGASGGGETIPDAYTMYRRQRLQEGWPDWFIEAQWPKDNAEAERVAAANVKRVRDMVAAAAKRKREAKAKAAAAERAAKKK